MYVIGNVPHSTHVEVRQPLLRVCSSTMWVLAVEHLPSGLVANAFTHQAISLAHGYLIFYKLFLTVICKDN